MKGAGRSCHDPTPHCSRSAIHAFRLMSLKQSHARGEPTPVPAARVSRLPPQLLPINIPTANTSAPPNATCSVADSGGVSMYFQRTQEITPSSTITTQIATTIAVQNDGIRNGSVWPIPPAVVISPQMPPRISGAPRPVRLPLSDSASAKPIEMPAPTDAAIPTKNACHVLPEANAAANTGARVDTEPSINPANPGWITRNTNDCRACAS